MKVSEIMTAPVVTVAPETAIAEVARLMLQHRISGLPVVDSHGAVVGIVTEGDLLRRAETGTERHRSHWLELLISPGRLAAEYAGAHARQAGEVMSPSVISVTPDDGLERVVALMERQDVKRLPVVEAGRLVGIVSRADLVRALARRLALGPQSAGRSAAGAAAATAGDADIRAQILAEIARQPWGPRASVDVKVSGGVVELFGSITDERERNALRILAENTAGVTAVQDRLVWVEPLSGFVVGADGPVVGSD
ncbi:MAG: CBS domain-containing protein [Thiohalocapsa sp.]